MEPNNLHSGGSYSTELSLGTEARDYNMLLGLPSGKRSTEKNTEACDRAVIDRVTSPSCKDPKIPRSIKWARFFLL